MKMNVEISHLNGNIKEESIENDSGLDDSCKSNGFLYVDMNDYNENNFGDIDIKEEEEQVEDLLLANNTVETGDICFEESLPLNSLKNLANHSQFEEKIIHSQSIDKNVKRRGAMCKPVQKENISVTTLPDGCGENSDSKRYTLRTRTWSQTLNLDSIESTPRKRKNVKLYNKSKTAVCLKTNIAHSEHTNISDDTQKADIKCSNCSGTVNGNSLDEHTKMCTCRTFNSSSQLNCNNLVNTARFEVDIKDCVKNYKCSKCNRTFKKKNNLTSHILKNECRNYEYVCAHCNQMFNKKTTLKKHIIAHVDNKMQCQKCFLTFSNSTSLKGHICSSEIKNGNPHCRCSIDSHQSKSLKTQNTDVSYKCQCKESLNNESLNASCAHFYNCQICEKSYKGIISYRKHLKSHKDNNKNRDVDVSNGNDYQELGLSKRKLKYKCDTCGKLFTKLVKLKIHILNVHQGVNYQCEKCSEKFLSVDDLNTHRTEDMCKVEDLRTCKICGKVFAKRDYLKKHQYMHMNVLFKCKFCYCAFMKEKSYKKHMEKMNCSKSARKIRMAEFNYKKCRLCEIEYETEEFLIDHFRVSHVGQEPHQCFCCDSCLPTFLELQNHIHQHNIQKYTCNLCGKPYTSQEGFRKHRLKHKGAEFKCRFCESEFLNENRFKFHEKTCKKNPDSTCEPSEKKEKKKKDGKPKQSRQLHWESRIIMKRLRGDPAMLSGDQKYTVNGQQNNSVVSTFFDEPETEMNNERGWFDNYYKTEEDDIAFGLKKAEDLTPQHCRLDLDMSEFLTKKKKTNSPPSTVPGTAEDHEPEPDVNNSSDSSSENSSSDSEEEIESTDLPVDYNPKRCRLCVISFGQEYELLHHFIKSHPGEYAHKCPHCGVQSPLYAQLKEHMKAHGIGIGIYNCDNCSKQFKSEKKMNSHNIRCKGINNDYSKKGSVLQSGEEGCKRCGKKFQTKFGYRRHKQLCKKKKEKNSAKGTRLQTKENTAADNFLEGNDLSEPEEESPKGVNGTVTETPSVLKVNTNSTTPTDTSANSPEKEKKTEVKSTYSGEPPMDSFPCRLCDKKFQYERGIVMHFKTAHPGHKPLICHVCNMHLADKLKEHLKTHGIGEEFICELCGKRFNQKFLSKIHEMWHEGIEYKCGNCRQKFLNKEKMDKHISENRCSNRQSLMRLPCDICGKSYRSKFGLGKHYITHTPKELRPVKNRMNCEYCGKWFDNNNGLQRHRRIHTGERPFCCRFCPKAFAQEGNCKAHERIHTGESKPKKKKPSQVASNSLPPGNPLNPQISTAGPFSLPVSTVESYPTHINFYSYSNVDPTGIVH